MAAVRCSFCARLEGEPHSARCGVTTNGFDPHYGEFPSEIREDRDRYREALALIASGKVGPSIMRMTACDVLGLEPPVWTVPGTASKEAPGGD